MNEKAVERLSHRTLQMFLALDRRQQDFFRDDLIAAVEKIEVRIDSVIGRYTRYKRGKVPGFQLEEICAYKENLRQMKSTYRRSAGLEQYVYVRGFRKAGKSHLLNCLLGAARGVVSPLRQSVCMHIFDTSLPENIAVLERIQNGQKIQERMDRESALEIFERQERAFGDLLEAYEKEEEARLEGRNLLASWRADTEERYAQQARQVHDIRAIRWGVKENAFLRDHVLIDLPRTGTRLFREQMFEVVRRYETDVILWVVSAAHLEDEGRNEEIRRQWEEISSVKGKKRLLVIINDGKEPQGTAARRQKKRLLQNVLGSDFSLDDLFCVNLALCWEYYMKTGQDSPQIQGLKKRIDHGFSAILADLRKQWMMRLQELVDRFNGKITAFHEEAEAFLQLYGKGQEEIDIAQNEMQGEYSKNLSTVLERYRGFALQRLEAGLGEICKACFEMENGKIAEAELRSNLPQLFLEHIFCDDAFLAELSGLRKAAVKKAAQRFEALAPQILVSTMQLPESRKNEYEEISRRKIDFAILGKTAFGNRRFDRGALDEKLAHETEWFYTEVFDTGKESVGTIFDPGKMEREIAEKSRELVERFLEQIRGMLSIEGFLEDCVKEAQRILDRSMEYTVAPHYDAVALERDLRSDISRLLYEELSEKDMKWLLEHGPAA